MSATAAAQSTDTPCTLLERDARLLTQLLAETAAGDSEVLDRLDHKLAHARVLSRKPATALVHIGSRVRYRDESTGLERLITLVVPDEADRDGERISLLSPVGSLLFGLVRGQPVEWRQPGGRRKRLHIVEVLS